MSARLRLTLSYAGFLVAAGAVVAFGVYIVLRYVPNYPLDRGQPARPSVVAVARQDILRRGRQVLGVRAGARSP